MKKRMRFNTQRILLTALIAVSFFGFLLWSIAQLQEEQEAILSATPIIKTANNSNKIILVASPKINQKIKSPVTIKAQGNEGSYKVKIKDSQGLTAAETTAQIKKGQKSFSINLKYKKPSAAKGFVEVFLPGENGAELYKISIPIIFEN